MSTKALSGPCALVLLAGLLASPAAQAANLFWSGAGADDLWSTPENWDNWGTPGPVPGTDDKALLTDKFITEGYAVTLESTQPAAGGYYNTVEVDGAQGLIDLQVKPGGVLQTNWLHMFRGDTVTQTGGTVTADDPGAVYDGRIYLGMSGTSAAYRITDGTLTTVVLYAGSGVGTSGEFTQEGGTVNVTNNLLLADRDVDNTNTGIYTISGGSLVADKLTFGHYNDVGNGPGKAEFHVIGSQATSINITTQLTYEKRNTGSSSQMVMRFTFDEDGVTPITVGLIKETRSGSEQKLIVDLTDYNVANGTDVTLIDYSTSVFRNGYDFEVIGGTADLNYGDANDSRVYLTNVAPALLLGDVNGDGVVDGLDIQPFVDLLTGGGYQAEADINADSVVDGLDIQPFVDIITGAGGSPVPEPTTLTLAVLGGLGWTYRRKRR